jgi:acyl-CoA thioester hydrolase
MSTSPNSSPSPGSAFKPQAHPRSAYRAFVPITTRWSDNDVYGHINNVAYYSFFDTAVNGWLIERGLLDIHQGNTIGLVVQTGCDYFASLAYPQPLQAGLRVAHLGRTSVRYEVGLFAADEGIAAAQGHFVHVMVDRHTRRPVAFSQDWINALETLRI